MKNICRFLFVAASLCLAIAATPAFAQGTAFTFQGQLVNNGVPANGNFDLQCGLYISPTLTVGYQIGSAITVANVPVVNGLFSTVLDFGANIYNGTNYWVDVAVRPSGSGAFANLNPRQALTPTPYAVYAEGASNVAAGTGLSGTYTSAVNFNNAGNTFTGNGSSLTLSVNVPLLNGNQTFTGSDTFNGIVTASSFRSDGSYDFVAGGPNNSATGGGATVAGGAHNTAGANSATIAGGQQNTASATVSTVAGGQQNNADGIAATIAGGQENTVTNQWATVGGGNKNTAGGQNSTVAGGEGNAVTGNAATVGGGQQNIVTNDYATIPGGQFNIAGGQGSFAAGQRAQALTDGSFVWADSQGAFQSTTNNQFLIRAQHGVNINTNLAGDAALNVNGTARMYDHTIYLRQNGDTNHGIGYFSSTGINGQWAGLQVDGPVVFGYSGGALGTTGTGVEKTALYWTTAGVSVYGTFNNNSDRNAKQDISSVDPSDILDKVTKLPVSEWSYKVDAQTRHIGPMAQDFYSQFNIGTDDRHIAPIDEGGVALTAIKGLNQKLEKQLKEKDDQIQDLKRQLQERDDSFERRLDEMQKTLQSSINQK
jgi:hypothetical protein